MSDKLKAAGLVGSVVAMLGLAVSSYAYSPSARPANAPTQQRAAVSTSVRMNAAGGACNHIGLSTRQPPEIHVPANPLARRYRDCGLHAGRRSPAA